MDETVRVKTLTPLRLAAVRQSAPPRLVGRALAAGLEEVWRRLNREAHVRVGPPMARYLHVDETRVEFEVGFPIEGDVSETSRVHVVSLPGGPAATVLHWGEDYDALSNRHAELDAWIAARDMRPNDARFEVYWVSPEDAADPGDVRTEVVQPVTIVQHEEGKA